MDQLSQVEISTWFVDTPSVKVTKQRLGFHERNQAHVRVRLQLITSTRRLTETPKMTWLSLITHVGAWVGLWELGITILTWFFAATKPFGRIGPMEPDDIKDAMQDRFDKRLVRRREKAARRIKEELENEYGVDVDYHKVLHHLVDQEATLSLRSHTTIESVLLQKDEIQAGLPDHVRELLMKVKNKEEDAYSDSSEEEDKRDLTHDPHNPLSIADGATYAGSSQV